jgi:hypothetical protein
MAYYAGKTGFLSITPVGGTATRLPLEEWSLELETEEVEFTNFESYGMKSLLGGIRGGTVSGSGQFESVAVGTVLADFQTNSGKVVDVELGLLQTGTIGFTVKAVLTGMTLGHNVKEKATFEFSGTLTNMDNTGAIVALQNQSIAAS